ncbi:MAG: hypothetical protein IT299_11515 [Dehalococcoidia bacterium]|nr:hypothetical protein [Dehalococcoidia bacterium]
MSSAGRLACPICNAEFATESERAAHRQAAHPSETAQERQRRNEAIDEQLRESFPASDAPSSSPVTGIGAPSAEPEGPEGPSEDGADEERARAGPQVREMQPG